jgi:hypothetical protein
MFFGMPSFWPGVVIIVTTTRQGNELMSYTLINNATLIAVQCATGAVTMQNTDTINGDLCAVESFLHSMWIFAHCMGGLFVKPSSKTLVLVQR